MRRLAAAAGVVSFLLASSANAQPVVHRKTDALVVSDVTTGGRSPVYTDGVQSMLIYDQLLSIAEGDAVARPDGTSATWSRIEAGEDGWIRDDALARGYVAWNINNADAGTYILSASGHSIAYVNGTPRAGDPYGFGFVDVPIQLDAGDNTILFKTNRRRQVRASITEPSAPLSIDRRDATLPDIVRGDTTEPLAAVVVVNATEHVLTGASIVASVNGATATTDVPVIVPFGTRKVPFTIPVRGVDLAHDAPEELTCVVEVRHTLLQSNGQQTFPLRVADRTDLHTRTFVSEIDGSVQEYAIRPRARRDAFDDGTGGALALSLHGAGVESRGQAACYKARDWIDVVAPTNRRKFGFDWEDWGRVDAMEVLADARARLASDPERIYLTGHSMGGHGTWQIGAHYPGTFAAIGPSAGWITFFSYVGGNPFGTDSPIVRLMSRAISTSDTLALADNYLHHGIYVLHGDKDNNVPVSQARTMREHLATYHPNFTYYERPGAGHWWGNQCMDWDPMFDYFQLHTNPQGGDVRSVAFTTMNPAVSASCDWVRIHSQERSLEPSVVDISFHDNRFVGTTTNVRTLALDALAINDLKLSEPIKIELDGTTLEARVRPDGRVFLERAGGAWTSTDPPIAWQKGPHRAGPFKEAFRNRTILVYGTRGDDAMDKACLDKARFDAETFWYRGNGAFDVIDDMTLKVGLRRGMYADRNVILYGNAETNNAWNDVVGDPPMWIRNGEATVGTASYSGGDLACLLVYPRPDSDVASVGIVGATGLVGMRLSFGLPYFVSGIAYPDYTIIRSSMLLDESGGFDGIEAAGFFDARWRLE